jgi:uncharacterized protein YeaO (DUF488 family)
MSAILLKRVYDPPMEADGARVLVDRLWPRGLSRAKAGIDLWLKEAAPSTELRVWFGHRPERWEEFARRYEAELAANEPALARLRNLVARGTVSLLFAAHDPEHNNAVVLARLLGRTAPVRKRARPPTARR